jgi:hypothetical protein
MQNHHILILGFRRFAEKIMAVSLAICLCIVPAFPKDKADIIPAGNWAAVQNLKIGKSVSLRMISGDRIDGEFLGLDPDAIRLTVDKMERIFQRSSINEVWQLRAPDRKLNGTLIGMGAGTAAGAIVAGASGALKTGDSAGRAWGGACIMAGMGLGALFGALTDAAIKGDKLLYRK